MKRYSLNELAFGWQQFKKSGCASKFNFASFVAWFCMDSSAIVTDNKGNDISNQF